MRTDNIVVRPKFAKATLVVDFRSAKERSFAERKSTLESAASFLHALLAGDSLARAFTGASVGAGALAANGQTTAMAHAAIAGNIFQASDILLKLPAQLAFDHILAVEDAGQTSD